MDGNVYVHLYMPPISLYSFPLLTRLNITLRRVDAKHNLVNFHVDIRV